MKEPKERGKRTVAALRGGKDVYLRGHKLLSKLICRWKRSVEDDEVVCVLEVNEENWIRREESSSSMSQFMTLLTTLISLSSLVYRISQCSQWLPRLGKKANLPKNWDFVQNNSLGLMLSYRWSSYCDMQNRYAGHIFLLKALSSSSYKEMKLQN